MTGDKRRALGRELSVVARRWRTRLDERLKSLEMSQARWAVLNAIRQAGTGLSQKALAEQASDTDLAGQVALVENAVNRKVAAIVLAPSDPDALVPAMKKAWEAKIPVIVIDSAAGKGAENYHQSYLATDNKKAGELCAKALIDKIGTTGKIAVMSYTAGSGSEVERVGGFKKYIEAHSKLQIVGTFYSNSQMGTALNQTTDVLARRFVQVLLVLGALGFLLSFLVLPLFALVNAGVTLDAASVTACGVA